MDAATIAHQIRTATDRDTVDQLLAKLTGANLAALMAEMRIVGPARETVTARRNRIAYWGYQMGADSRAILGRR